MSMTRAEYDACSYDRELKQSVAPISYVLDPIKYEHCDKCRIELGVVGGSAVSHVRGNLVDLENDLRGQNRPATRCPEYKFVPRDDNILQGKEYIKPVAHPEIDTRMVHLKPCQMFSYDPVPKAPELNLFTCPKK